MSARSIDFRLDASFRDHPKIQKLERRLGADGVLAWISLLAFAARYRTDGQLSAMDDEDIELAARWRGEPGALVATLIELHLLDEICASNAQASTEHCLRNAQAMRHANAKRMLALHDWVDHNGYAASFAHRSERAKAAAAARWARKNLENFDGGCASNAQASTEHCLRNAPSPIPIPTPDLDTPLTPLKGGTAKEKKASELEIWFKTEFQPRYPANRRRNQVKTALARLREIKPTVEQREQILDALERWKTSEEWTKDGGRFVPGIGNFFVNGLYAEHPNPKRNEAGAVLRDVSEVVVDG
jgi:hypothetical protein